MNLLNIPDLNTLITLLPSIILGIFLGMLIIKTPPIKNYYNKDRFSFYFSLSLLMFAFMWIFTPNLLPGVAVFSTFIVAVLTFRTIEEMKEVRISQTRPHIIVDIDLVKNEPSLEVRIKNIGNGIAYNFTSKWDPELIDSRGRNNSELGFLKKITYLPPEKEVVSLFDSSISYYRKQPELPRKYKVEIKYEGEHREIYNDSYEIDLSAFENIMYLPRSSRA